MSITVVNCVYVACVCEQEIFIVIFAFGFFNILDRFGIYKKKMLSYVKFLTVFQT